VDLANLTPLEVPSDEAVVYRQAHRRCSEWIIATSGYGGPKCYTHVNRWMFPHPRKTWPDLPSWFRGPGFSIPGNDSGLWAAGVRRLLAVSLADAPRYRGQYLYDISYGGHRTDGLERVNVRFYPQCFTGRWHATIQGFERWDGQWQRTKRMVYWPIDEARLGHMLLYALEKTYERAQMIVLPHETAEEWVIHEDGSWERKR
jgi:hypothetical protein